MSDPAPASVAGGTGAFAPYGQLGRSGFGLNFGNPPGGNQRDTEGTSHSSLPGFAPFTSAAAAAAALGHSRSRGAAATPGIRQGASPPGVEALLMHAEELLRARGGSGEAPPGAEAAARLAAAPFARRSATAAEAKAAVQAGRRAHQRRRGSASVDDDASGGETHTG